MELNKCIEKIERYLRSSDTHPRIVNINNIDDLSKLKEHFCIGDNIFLAVTDYCKEDENPSKDKAFNDLNQKRGNVFLTEFTTAMKLLGEDELKQFLSQLIHSSDTEHKLVVFCYQCEECFITSDRRLKDFIYYVEGDCTPKPKLIFSSQTMPTPENIIIADGINNVAYAIENNAVDEIYVKTNKHKNSYKCSLYSITEESDPYDALCNIDIVTSLLDKNYGTEEQWSYALSEVSKHNSWAACITDMFSSHSNLELVAHNWLLFDINKRWLYFIALKIYGSKNNWCLGKAAKNSKSMNSLLRSVYRSILDEDSKENEFWEKYNKRKDLIKSFCSGNIDDNDIEVIDYCEMVKSTGDNILYYLTDSTGREKHLIFESLQKYGYKNNYDEIIGILKHIYPDLYTYLLPYRFNNGLLDKYFQDYKYEKVINKIFPEFEEIVEEQSQKRDFYKLPPRSSKTEAIGKKDSYLYFMDSMGVEFLGFIMEKCREYEMIANVTVCRCELPSLTFCNKEFIDLFKEAGATLFSGEKGIKKLDDIKHNGEENCDYQKTKLPLHLSFELEIVDDILKDINARLKQGMMKKAVMISDHGASRLAVIKENTLDIDVNSKGTNGGRVCEYNDEVSHIPSATQVEYNNYNYYVLSNYNRFKGGRAASVETHGGATLEEVIIPIIEITKAMSNIEISILTPRIKFSTMKKNAEIKIFSKTKLTNVTVSVNDKFYDVVSKDDQNFDIKMPNLRKACSYIVKVYSDNNKIGDDLQFIAEKEGFATKDLL